MRNVVKAINAILIIFNLLMGLRKNNSIKDDIDYKFFAVINLIIFLNI